MPVRHEGDFQRKHIGSWDSWIDEAIVEAQARGEFDDLPDAGKPIRLEDSPFAPEMASALRTLKNAGYAPTWMEIDRQITQGKEEMAVWLERSAQYLRERLAELTDDEQPNSQVDVNAPWWRRILQMLNFAADLDEPVRRHLSRDDLVVIRSRMCEQYLERAAAVDKHIAEFAGALPRELWHLERMRLTPEQATKTFDSQVPSGF